MNWENYKTLTKKQKEEYNFKFKRDRIESPGSVSFLFGLYALSMMYVMLSYMILTEPKFAPLSQHAETFIKLGGMAMTTIIIYVLFLLLSFIIGEGIRYYKEWRLLKQWGKKKQRKGK